MSPRLAGALLALTAAALIALSLIMTSWWVGHPAFDGKEIEAKTIFVGPFGADGCNTGGDGKCQVLEMRGSSSAIGYVGLGATSLLAFAAVVLALSTLIGSEGRKVLAKLVIVLGIASAAVAIAIPLIGVHLKASNVIVMHFGPGMYMLWAAVVTAVLGAVLAKRPFPKPELRPSRAAIAPALAAPPTQQPVDVLALLQEDSLRPAAPGPEPELSRPSPSSPGGMLAGPAGPLGVGSARPAPLFSAAPRLRPLYDADPNVGGTGGYVPGAAPQLPSRGPTPISMSAASAIAGLPTPVPFQAPEPPKPPPITTQGVAAVPNLPPRTKPPSMSPPPSPPSRTSPVLGAKALPDAPPPSRTSPPLGAKSLPDAPPPRTGPPPPGSISARLKASSVPPPPRTNPGTMPAPTGPRTLAAAVVPPPPAAPPAAFKLPVRPVSDPAENAETIDRDAMTVDRREEPAVSVGRPATGEGIGDSTDANVPLTPPDTEEGLAVRPPPDTEEAPALRPPTDTDDIETAMVEKQSAADVAPAPPPPAATEAKLEAEVARQSNSEIETIAREKLSARELLTGDSTSPASERAASEPLAPGERAQSKIPITTAPDSLPPPKERQATSSGPSPACPQCESPMAWVEEHLRFYCKSCRMYF